MAKVTMPQDLQGRDTLARHDWTLPGLGLPLGCGPRSVHWLVSLGTRYSFLVLPLARSLPEVWNAAVIVIVVQSLIELFEMMFYLKQVPSKLLPIRSTI